MEKICLKHFSLQKANKIKSFIKKQPPQGFCKKGVLKKFYENHLKTPVLEKETATQVFFGKFCEISKDFFLQNTSGICLTVSFHKEVLYICSNLLLSKKRTKLTILLSFHFANTFYILLWLYFIRQNINTWNHISSL